MDGDFWGTIGGMTFVLVILALIAGLAATGGVITSVGLVLAATFSVLTVVPLVMMMQLGFIVAFGVLLDAIIVRSVLVPAITMGAGDRIWWPQRTASSTHVAAEPSRA